MKNIDFSKGNGLVPAVIQDNDTLAVLMVGFMNEEALEKTLSEGRVTFFSRSKNRLWTKGVTSGNYLRLVSISPDCDNDTLLVRVIPSGPVCHTGSYSCFDEPAGSRGFLYRLQDVISRRISENAEGSYVNKLYKSGLNRVARKVGEEAVELILESKDNDREAIINEAADLFFHSLILLHAKGIKLEEIEETLAGRHK